MGKAKKGNQQANPMKETVKSIKEGQVKKNKLQKFKQTPSGKVPLINGNGKANGNSKLQKQTKPVPQQSPSPQKNQKKNKNKNKNQNKSPQGGSPQKQSQKKKPTVEVPAEEDSDEDINEGISLPEDVSNLEDDSDASSDEEVETPNILGASLANTSDEDDEDFEASDDSEEEEVEVNKGVKKFKGLKKMEPKESSEDDEDSDVDEDDEDEEDQDAEDSDEENVEKSVTSSVNSSMDISATTEDSDSEEEDDDDDDDDGDEEEDDDGPGLKALLGESLVDQEDDEDFEAESDDEDASEAMSDEEDDEEDDAEGSQEEKNTSNDSSRFIPTDDNPLLTEEQKAEQDTRTIYIGNVPKDLEEKVLKATFKKFGPIQSLRVRGCVPEDPKMKLKVAHIKKKFHPLSKSLCVYIVYKSKDSVDKALALNGQKLGGNYIRVDRIGTERKADPKKSVFLGNVPYDVEDNELWDMFSKCGKVDYVRTIRDRNTGCCRGIAYINFVEAEGATLALNLNGTVLRKREIRVNRYNAEKQNKSGQKRSRDGKVEKGTPKRQKTDVERATENSVNAQKRQSKKMKGSPKKGNSPGFQGHKADGGKKKGFKKGGNKFDKKKKNTAAKLLAPKKFKNSQ